MDSASPQVHNAGMGTSQMIEHRHIRPGTVPDLTPGSLLCSLGGERSHFVGGYINEQVSVELDSMRFAPVNKWNRPAGYLISGILFEVDLNSGEAGGQSELAAGSLLLMGDRLALCAIADKGRYLVAIDTENPIERDVSTYDLIFRRWQIASRTGDQSMVLYTYGGVSSKAQS